MGSTAATINLNVLDASYRRNVKRIFYSSSACMYPEYSQLDPDNPGLAEDSAYPAAPDSEYGWEKLFSERLYLAYARNHDMTVRIARYHNVFGPEGSWNDGKEKAPAALCRKIAVAKLTGKHDIEIWGDGEQTRSFCFIDDCVEGQVRLMDCGYHEPLNLCQDRMITINGLADIIADCAGIVVTRRHVAGPQGVRGRNSDNTRLRRVLGWEPQVSLEEGVGQTYRWIEQQVQQKLTLPSRP